MKFKSLARSFLTSLLLISPFSAFASSQLTPCPSFEIVKIQANTLDTVRSGGDNSFTVTSSKTFYDNNGNRVWSLVVPVGAQDYNSAMIMARDQVAQIDQLKMEFADYSNGFYLCDYSAGRGNLLYIISEQGDRIEAMKNVITKLHAK